MEKAKEVVMEREGREKGGKVREREGKQEGGR